MEGLVLAFVVVLASAGPVPQPLPPEEERLEQESLEQVQIVSAERQVPAWPDMRPFRRAAKNGALVGLAIGAVSGILIASAIPDQNQYPLRPSCRGIDRLEACF